MSAETVAPKMVYEAVRDPKPQAIVVHCSDPRFQSAFEQFIERELHLPKGKYIPLVVGGGAGVLAHPEQLPKEFKFIKERFELYRDHFPSLRRIVLINHEDCKYYDTLKEKILSFMGAHFRDQADQAHEDLSFISRSFFHLLSHLNVTVELYFARFADAEHSRIVFDKAG